MNDNEMAVYKIALAKWGPKAQIGVWIEECGEVLVAWNKMFREINGGSLEDFNKEVVDLEIMTEVMSIIFDKFPRMEDDFHLIAHNPINDIPLFIASALNYYFKLDHVPPMWKNVLESALTKKIVDLQLAIEAVKEDQPNFNWREHKSLKLNRLNEYLGRTAITDMFCLNCGLSGAMRTPGICDKCPVVGGYP
jgi:hypothetical protein